MDHISATDSGTDYKKFQLTYIFKCVLNEPSSELWWARWCGKKNQSFRVRETKVQISLLKLITLMIWGKYFSIGRGIITPIHLGGGVWIIPITRGCYWKLISGWGHGWEMSCKEQQSPVPPRIVPPKIPTVFTIKNFSPSVSSVVRIVIGIPTFKAKGEV